MPDRIVRQRILTSEKVDQLDHGAEVFYRRLLNVVDDFGRFDARPAIIRAACYPLRIDRTREADCSRWLAACQKAGLIALYVVDGKPYLEVLNLGDRRRAKHSKYPPPPDGACQHVLADDGTRQHVRPESDSESDSESTPKPPRGDSSPGFDQFWTAWPPHDRKEARKQTFAHWRSQSLEAEVEPIIACLQRWKVSDQWTRDGGKYIPAPLVWLRKENWRSAAPPPTSSNGAHVPSKPLARAQVFDMEADQ